MNSWHNCIFKYKQPVLMHHERHYEIQKQNKAKPFHDKGDALIIELYGTEEENNRKKNTESKSGYTGH